jgi:hypothetical protein
LFVGGFSPALNSQQLRAAFELCGRVENAQGAPRTLRLSRSACPL